MSQRTDRTVTVLRAILHEIRVERITFMAGSIAYHAFVSLLPLLLVLLAAVSAVGGQQLEEALLSVTQAAFTPGAAEVLVSELDNASVEASALGIAVLVWGALRIFRSLDAAFSDIYETESENTVTNQFVDAILVFVSIAAVVVAVIAIESVLSPSTATTFGWIAQRIGLVVAIAAALAPMYYLFPDEPDMTVREVVPGVAVTAVGLVVFESLFRFYLEYSSTAAEGQFLSSILVFLTWLYFSSLLLLVGVAVNAVLSNRSRDVNIEPVIGGVPLEESPPDAGEEATVDPAVALERLERQLSTASTMTFVVDGESVTVPVPDRVEVTAGSSVLPAIDGGTGIELRWSTADGEFVVGDADSES
ncbi:YihY/virulence factor BrkB family protein [Natrinema zhouii]|uniref:YihY/virulence factor BrkB family protein n=1 Tax=Natrinema zhouii TaxID=1710539 RepID=A0A7D6CR05_9EURY|nr:YihY/virulence factor BrkB family protein [Natrinema zhouii]QLK27036.1 YihY/virulence factor BrkB family protein [Natrinema zhouii]